MHRLRVTGVMSVERIESFVGGRWVAGSGKITELLNPATEEVVAVAARDGLDYGDVLTYARTEGHAALAALTFAERGALLGRMADALQGAREPLIAAATVNGGCTRGDAKFDIDGAILVLTHYAELGRQLGDTRVLIDGEGSQLGRSPRFWGQHVHVPRRGVAVLINAFNFPAWGFAEKTACALLAGVPVVSKAATATALTAYRCARALISHAALPKGVFSFVAGASAPLLDHLDGQDTLAFTGSAKTGRTLRSHPRVIERSPPVNVEADSLNAAVLDPELGEDSEGMLLFLREIAREMTQKTGQKCTAVRRVIVPESHVDRVVAALGAQLDDFAVGDPAKPSVRMGPLTTAQQLEDVRAGTEALCQDADVVYGSPGRPPLVGVADDRGFFFDKVVLVARDPHRARYVHELEVFGPVATIVPYSGDADEAIALVHRGQGSLVTSVYTDRPVFAEKLVYGVAPYSGRVYLGSSKVAAHAMGSGLVLPQCTHGGPGRAGGGEELGGLRGLRRFMQRTAVQGARPLVERVTGTRPS